MGTGELVFIKGKTYKGKPFIHSDPIGIELLDEQGEIHAITTDEHDGAWQKYFKPVN